MASESWTSERRTARHEAVVLENDRVRYARRDAKVWAEVDAMAADEEERRKAPKKLNDGNFGAPMPAPPEEGWDWF
ncbi:hypothetical protein [Rhodococcus sp. AW25M09]|uniref:hypothetical protein n=1 Tax=Rhodococcus sp. AW25M09 TaxID=1268303 RepID=UPI0012FADA53|nr:hypothetical protein [Rhodococcus sp. AW25M09]